jgi:hypothetical protein
MKQKSIPNFATPIFRPTFFARIRAILKTAFLFCFKIPTDGSVEEIATNGWHRRTTDEKKRRPFLVHRRSSLVNEVPLQTACIEAIYPQFGLAIRGQLVLHSNGLNVIVPADGL